MTTRGRARAEVLYEDNHLLVLDKPPNVPVQADASGDLDLLSIGKAYIKQTYDKPGNVFLGLVHRLDRPVGGVLVFARTSKAAARLSEDMQRGLWRKRYLTVVCGQPQENGECEDYLCKNEHTRMSAVCRKDDRGAKLARMQYRLSAHNPAQNLSLLDIELLTGRHHQIRVQLSSRGFPVWGDARYNPDSRPGQQIALWAHELRLIHPTMRERLTFVSSVPGQFPWTLGK